MVMVDVRGVKFPAYIDQLDFPYFKKFSENKLFPKKKDKKYIDDVRYKQTKDGTTHFNAFKLALLYEPIVVTYLLESKYGSTKMIDDTNMLCKDKNCL